MPTRRACPQCYEEVVFAWDSADGCESPRCRRCGPVFYWLVVDSRGRIVAGATAHEVTLAAHVVPDLRALLTHVHP